MRLMFRVPEGWTARRDGDWVTIERGAFGTRVVAAPLTGKGADPRPLFERDLPPGSTVEYLQILDPLETDDGWRMKLVTLEVKGPGGARLEIRIGAVYEMLYYVGTAIARIAPAAAEADRAAVVELLQSARPHLWPDDPVSIAELWSMEDP
jgi:hypothetical protein